MPPQLQERLSPYISGIAKQNRLTAQCVGGVEDHVHVLLSLPPTVPISKAMQLIKGAAMSGVHPKVVLSVV